MTALGTSRMARLAAGGVIAALFAGTPALAQEAAPPPEAEAEASSAPSAPAVPAEPSTNAMENLIRLLVQQKTITPEAGQALLQQAQTEAQQAQARQAALAPPEAGTVRVPYVPQVVKDEIRDQLRREVVEQAKAEGWATPGSVPDWVSKVRLSGDVRFRSQWDMFDNANALAVVDYDGFNADGPIDPAEQFAVPLLNTRVDRLNRLSIRARLAIEAEPVEGVTLAARLASGNNDGPVSTTQLLGGGFGKKDIWLDRAYISYEATEFAAITLGRMPNPFSSTDLLFDEDVNFDGAALTLNSADWLGESLKVSAVAGAFPFEYISGDAPSGRVEKIEGRDKYIFSGQLIGEYEAGQLGATLSVGYHDFSRVRGEVSAPCFPYLGEPDCSTDVTRPAFMQKGNSLILLRQIPGTPEVPEPPQAQFVGLLFDYDVLEVNGEVKYDVGEDLRLTLGGSYVRNLAYDEGDICRAAVVNNITVAAITRPGPTAGSRVEDVNGSPCTAVEGSEPLNDGGPLLASFESGGTGWMVSAGVGSKELKAQSSWAVNVGYKRLEPDAVLDSLTDSDFHLGGTNAEGYIVSGSYMIFDNIRFTARYLSASEVYGPEPLAIDVLQLDLVAGF